MPTVISTMEMNTCIQEHTITEEVVNYDLIKEQIKLAAGETSVERITPERSIQCRITRRTRRAISLTPGTHHRLPRPGGHGVRLDTHVYPGTRSRRSTTTISKLIVVAQTREEAILKMQRALDEYVIEGIKTTIPFHQRLMRHDRFRSGDFTTKFMEEKTFDFLALNEKAGQCIGFLMMFVVDRPGTKGITSTRPPRSRTSSEPTMKPRSPLLASGS